MNDINEYTATTIKRKLRWYEQRRLITIVTVAVQNSNRWQKYVFSETVGPTLHTEVSSTTMPSYYLAHTTSQFSPLLTENARIYR